MKKVLTLASLGLLIFPGIALSHKAERMYPIRYGVMYQHPCLVVKYPRQTICSWFEKTGRSSFVVEHCRDLGGLPRSGGEYCDITLDDAREYTFMKD